MKFENDIEIGEVVYINHQKYKVKKIIAEIDKDGINQFYYLDFIDKNSPSCFPMEYTRDRFMNAFQYKNYIIDIANSL